MSNDDIKRITILTVLIAIFFGLTSYFKDQKFELLSIELGLSVISQVFLLTALIPFILYLLTLGINQTKDIRFKLRPTIFYDIGIFLTTIIFAYTILILSGLKLVILF